MDELSTKHKTITVTIPGPFNLLREALASCAIEGNQFAIDALETIRRVENGEPVGELYANRLNEFFQRAGVLVEGTEPEGSAPSPE